MYNVLIHIRTCTYLDNVTEFYISIGLSYGGAELAEDDGLLGYGDILLCAVIHVVHSHTHQLRRVVDGSFQFIAPRGENVGVGGHRLLHSSLQNKDNDNLMCGMSR